MSKRKIIGKSRRRRTCQERYDKISKLEAEVRELKHKLKDMNIPESRRNLFDDNNVRWLLRNLAIRNKNHPEFKNVISKLTALSKDKNPLIIK